MRGKDCVAVASDSRFGIEFHTVSSTMQKTFRLNDCTLLALAGLATDVETVRQEMDQCARLYRARERREMAPRTAAAALSALLYQRRFGPWFVAPVLAGLGPGGAPFVNGSDCLGALVEGEPPFVCAGTCEQQLLGICEALYRPDLVLRILCVYKKLKSQNVYEIIKDADELFEVVSQCLLAAVDRDTISGWGAEVFVLFAFEI